MLTNTEDYEFIVTEDDKFDTTPVRLLTGEFKDVIVCFGQLQVEEVAENGDAIVHFTYKIIEPGSARHKKRLEKNVHFKNRLGEILHDILEGISDTDEVGNDYIEEPNEERRILQKDSSVS